MWLELFSFQKPGLKLPKLCGMSKVGKAKMDKLMGKGLARILYGGKTGVDPDHHLLAPAHP